MLKQTLSEAEGFALVVSMTWPARDELACFVALTATQSDNLFAGRYCGRELPRKIWLASNGSGGQCWGTDGNARLNYVALIWGICLRYVSLRQVPVLGTTDACFSRRAGNSTVLGH